MAADPVTVLELVVSTRAGGGPQHVLTVASALRGRGFAPIVAGPRDGPLFERFRSAGLEAIELGTDRLRLRTLARVVGLVRARSVRLIHSHGKGAGLYGRLAARLTGVPALHTLHGLHYERYGRAARAAYLALERRLARWTYAVVNVSRVQEAEALALGLFTPAQSRLIVNGVDVAGVRAAALDRGAARRALGLEAAALVIGAVARLDEVKRLDLLLRAAARVRAPAPRLLLVGDGPERARLRALAASVGLGDRVTFAGEVPEAARLLLALDVYAATARKEGLPLALLEAMALGLPVVATDIPAHHEVLGDAWPGLVAPTEAALADAFEALLGDASARAALGAAGHARAAAAFDAGRMIDALAALYGEAARL